MDYKFWLSFAVAVLTLWFTWRPQRNVAGKMSGRAILSGLWRPALITVLLAVIWVPYLFPRASSIDAVTVENVQPKIRQWLDHFHMASQQADDPESYFLLIVTLQNGRKVRVERLKAYENYITFTSTITMDQSAQDLFNSFSQRDRNRLKEELALALSRAKIAMYIDDNLKGIVMNTRLPITPTLSEADFIGRIDDMDFANAGVLATILLSLPSPPPAQSGK